MNLQKINQVFESIDKKVLMCVGAIFLVLAMFFPPLAIVFVIIAIALLGFGVKDLEAVKKMFEKKVK
jgi:hypothetical protein